MTQQTGEHEARWTALVAFAGEGNAKVRLARVEAMATVQRRDGRLPGWADTDGWEGLYEIALCAFEAGKLTADSDVKG